MKKRVAIIGGGPIGLAAAVGCLARGHEPSVFETDTPGASLRRWGPTRFFTPLAMNVAPSVLELAGAHDGTALLTGPETADLLAKAAGSPLLAPYIHSHTRVTSVTRARLSRGDMAGHPVRAELPFSLVLGERSVEVDAVLDASGTSGNPIPLPIAGAPHAIRDLGTLADTSLRGKRVLVLGHGHSAANALVALEDSGAHVTWAVRSRNRRPIATVPGDPLPERARVVSRANALAEQPPGWLRVERAAFIESFAGGTAKLSGDRTVDFDVLVALLGYRPDHSIVSELPLELGAATEGVARLERALANVTDCLSVPAVAPADLASGEPRFHFIGAKSYGRARTFLLQTGYAQLETVLDGLFA